MSSEATSHKFATSIKSDKVSAAVKLLTSEISGGILPLNEKTFHLLQTKYLEPNPCHPDAKCDTPDTRIAFFQRLNPGLGHKISANR